MLCGRPSQHHETINAIHISRIIGSLIQSCANHARVHPTPQGLIQRLKQHRERYGKLQACTELVEERSMAAAMVMETVPAVEIVMVAAPVMETAPARRPVHVVTSGKSTSHNFRWWRAIFNQRQYYFFK
jgi:hypothetical protein